MTQPGMRNSMRNEAMHQSHVKEGYSSRWGSNSPRHGAQHLARGLVMEVEDRSDSQGWK